MTTSSSQGISSRNLHGWGATPPTLQLPHQAKVAVSLVINFEEGAEWSIADGDPTTERVAEVHSVVPAGVWDQGTEQQFAYGMRAGVWRFLDALRRHNRTATFYMCGQAVERSPHIAAQIVAQGHEAACHGWRWRPHADYDHPARERADLQRCIEVTQQATGQRPWGFFCRGSESRWTRALLQELDFEYASNGLDDDLPYFDTSLPAPMLVMPYALDSNDMKFFHPNGFACADEMVTYVSDALDVLIAEGERGTPKLLNIGYHLRITGRPGRFAAFERVLQLLERLGDSVWVASRLEIARLCRQQMPHPHHAHDAHAARAETPPSLLHSSL
ncbi:polysaccharide deacetylase [Lampropedia puyangensis]|uniref:Polysaccharide deacetylase n=1 Tax=Lampropedia puyangensis TaxID=1330072 RepID=A0A4S8FE41_9BURK|nr:polysaccharide deacetylase family protein [Lampropedia puyangensis]THU04984.1 polysaccharide deacetylase [Lampropedia puyangensis]